MSNGFLRHPLLASRGVEHGFGTRAAMEVADVLRPRQVHGCAVARPDSLGELQPAEADAVDVDSQVGNSLLQVMEALDVIILSLIHI